MKQFLKKFATVVCVIVLVLFSSTLLADKEAFFVLLPGVVVIDGLMVLFLWLLHRKKPHRLNNGKEYGANKAKQEISDEHASIQSSAPNVLVSQTETYKNREEKVSAISGVDIQKESNQISHSVQINECSSSISDLLSRIPKEVVDLLWFKNGPLHNYFPENKTYEYEFIQISFKGSEEPSAIDLNLPISVSDPEATPLNYYPSYEELSPNQRTAYFKWLCDISSPIDIGYVFIFYYGLERHLFLGNDNAALDMIMKLRKFHDHGSFLGYSESAITLYAILHQRTDLLQTVGKTSLDSKLQLFADAIVNNVLSPQRIIAMHNAFDFRNTNYIKKEPELFLTTLSNLLLDKYGVQGYPIVHEDYQKCRGNLSIMLANYSLAPEQRYFELPDISTSPRVHTDINNLLAETHETVKDILKERRKEAKSNS